MAMMTALAADPALSDPPMSPDTLRILETINARRAALDKADLAAARRLQAVGDQAYKSSHYAAAFTAYANAYPNYPLPEAYILAGDAHWRAVLQAQSRPPSDPVCEPDGRRFARALALDLAQHHAVGLALAPRDPGRKRAALFARAEASASCMAALLPPPEPFDAPPACFNFNALRHCLGAPLIP